MKLGVISDIHGNRIALEAVLADMPAVDGLVCAGDVVGYNPWHADCVEEIRERRDLRNATACDTVNGEVPTVQGNHDRAVTAGSAPHFNGMAQAGVEHALEQLSENQIEWLDSLPVERHVADGRVKVVHGHPDDPDHYTRPHEFGPGLLDDEDVLVMGHTHVQHHEMVKSLADSGGIIMNPGSVGQPRDGDPRAAYAVLDLDEMTVDEHRVDYDVEAVIQAVEETGLPREIGARLTRGR